MARYTKSGEVVRVPQINSELENIQLAFQDTLSRVGDTPNQMETPLDMNSNRIFNLPKPETQFEPARLVDLTSIIGDINLTPNASEVDFDGNVDYIADNVEMALELEAVLRANIDDNLQLLEGNVSINNTQIVGLQTGVTKLQNEMVVVQQRSLNNAVSVSTLNSSKAARDQDAVEDNIAIFDNSGNPVDSGIPITNLTDSSAVYVQDELPTGLITNGALWYQPTFGSTYVYYTDVDSSQWVEVFSDGDEDNRSPQSYETASELENLEPELTGQRAEVRERANAQYELAASGYTALPGDIVAANNRVWKLLTDNATIKSFGASVDELSDDHSFFSIMGSRLGRVVIPSGIARISTSFESTYPIYFNDGASLSIDAGVTVDHKNYVFSERQHIFKGEGTFFFGQFSNHTIKPEWFGAFPSDFTGVSEQLQKLSDSVQADRETYIPFEEGTWYLDSGVEWSRACRLDGAGKRITHFRCIASFNNGDVFTTAGQGVTFNRIQFSTDGIRQSGRYIGLDHNNCEAEDIWFTDGYQGVEINANACKATDVHGFVWSSADDSYIVGIADGTNGAECDLIYYFDSAGNEPHYVVKCGANNKSRIGKVNGDGFRKAALGVSISSGTLKNLIVDSVVASNGENSVSIITSGAASVESVDLSLIKAENVSGVGYEMIKGGSGVFKYVTTQQLQVDDSVGGFSVNATSGTIDHFSIMGGFVRNNSGAGVSVDNSNYWSICHLDCVSNGGGGTLIGTCSGFTYTNNKNLFNTGFNLDDQSGSVGKVIANNL